MSASAGLCRRRLDGVVDDAVARQRQGLGRAGFRDPAIELTLRLAGEGLPLKILIVNTLYPPEIIGGAEVSVSLLAEALVQRGHQVAVVCLQNKPDRTVDEAKGVRVYRLPLDNDYWPFGNDRKPSSVQRLKWHLKDTWNRRSAARFAEILDLEKPDVVHTNNLTGFSVSLWSQAKQRNIRIVHTLRDYSLLCKRSTLFRGDTTCAQRCTLCATMTSPYLLASRMVDAVVSNSQFVLDQHTKLKYFPRTDGRVIFNIADPGSVVPSPPSDSNDLIFGFIGRIEAEKGIEVVLRAAEQLPDNGWQLKIAGKGLEDYVRGLKGRSGRNVEWLGFAKSAEFYAGIDVCLVSSVWPEPLPRTLIESINAGRATICSTAGGIPEIAGFSNLIGSYEPNDHKRLGELMLKAVNERSHWKLARPPLAGFAERFSADSVTGQYLDVYLNNNRTNRQ
ncbi:glycosyltransferase family 4 protein [Bradyrhizobium cajani]|uniref:glycosyltransferase family 4 protein n=1 Tax=Bradyrhizobium cajani TaxID=1928661 RepID=UPI001FEC7484|nr:glycosyltransferase family 4 protein [Bradyrhizobium cajani]MCP3373883.1 glycosyltransferase family 4 protein [Bradyrhizobium cajani]